MEEKQKKKIWIGIFVLCIVALIVLHFYNRSAADENAALAAADGAGGPAAAMLVDFENDVADGTIRKLERKYGLRLRHNSRFSKMEQLFRSARKHADPYALARKLRGEPGVERAEADQIVSIPPMPGAALARPFLAANPEPDKKKFPNDPKYRYQWHLNQIGMPAAWPKATGKGVIVAVIDTGVAYANHEQFKQVPDLAQTAFVKGYDFVNDHERGLDDHGHGTHVAGTIAQSTHNNVGVAGMAYRSQIMPLKVLSAKGFGNVADIAEAIRFAADNGAKVINMSLGSNRPSRIMGAAVKYALDKGVVVVCAAGNNGQGKVSYPAAYPGVIAVAATQFDRTTTFYSNWGKEIDVAAPGGNTRVDQNNDGMPDGVLQNTIIPGRPEQNDYLLFMGTSMASPHVAGAAAMIIERGVTKPGAVEKLLESTARHPKNKARDDRYGAGIIDVSAALDKSTSDWGLYKLGISAALGLLLLGSLRSRSLLSLKVGPGAVIGLLVGSSGLFFLGSLGLGNILPGPVEQLVTNGAPAWGAPLLGPGNALFYSLLLPLGLTIALYGSGRLRGLLVGFVVGVAGHLVFHLVFDTVDITWIPNVMAMDQIWLSLNALACMGLAHVLARK